MLIQATRTQLQLAKGQSTRLTEAAHARLSSAGGTLWVTIDNDRRDLVLEAGEGLDVDGSEPIIVSALGGPAVLDLRPSCASA
ncbi:DUF2917 domain-containing protein [Pelomonas sp. SE-A7]|uniref:DUF2917 domain-containing protein n=1 Tax=Pelomonas sp. SE-A7 TaxID=3054953 RepID=UPI00259CD53A|nr:DUF2917 domain-containing protein [Pelomonas sp. SE-A7]MDM4764608.1 DUF2917 domain-containing protein [Pelomonas sp. SE-A7]